MGCTTTTDRVTCNFSCSNWSTSNRRESCRRNWFAVRLRRESPPAVAAAWAVRLASNWSFTATLSILFFEVLVAGRAKMIWPLNSCTCIWVKRRLTISPVRRNAVKPNKSTRARLSSLTAKATPAKARAMLAGIGTACRGTWMLFQLEKNCLATGNLYRSWG